MGNVMLYFGSFNPIHKGHIAIAEYVLSEGLASEVWFVVSPKNPLKPNDLLIDEQDRIEMVHIAIAGSRFPDRMRACDVEFSMPRPSYTVDTLKMLADIYPDAEFSLLFGTDIVGQFFRWKDWQYIQDNYNIYIYPRRGYEADRTAHPFHYLDGMPYFDYSSTEVRVALQDGDGKELLPVGVYNYIKEHDLWK